LHKKTSDLLQELGAQTRFQNSLLGSKYVTKQCKSVRAKAGK